MSTTTAAGAVDAARQDTVRRLLDLAAVAVVRLPRSDDALRAVDAVREGGVHAIEITLTTPGALELIERLAGQGDGEMVVGVGSVLHADDARRAVEAGARYVVSPAFRPAVIAETLRLGAASLPGAFSPTEILAAHEAGADVVKITPAEVLGPAFIRSVLGPMPFLRMMPTGGVTPENAGDWLRAGAVAVGLGSALVDPALVAAGGFAELTDRARCLVRSIADARGGGAR